MTLRVPRIEGVHPMRIARRFDKGPWRATAPTPNPPYAFFFFPTRRTVFFLQQLSYQCVAKKSYNYTDRHEGACFLLVSPCTLKSSWQHPLENCACHSHFKARTAACVFSSSDWSLRRCQSLRSRDLRRWSPMKTVPTGQIAPSDAHRFQPGTRSGGPRCPPNTPADGDSSRS